MELLRLPNLRWVALSRNPFLDHIIAQRTQEPLPSLDDPVLVDTKWSILGQGAGGITRKVDWEGVGFVAVKTFAGELTSDGSPQDERAISVAAASMEDPSLIRLLGQTTTSNASLVMEFLDGYEALAGPPSMESCSRDVYSQDRSQQLSPDFAWIMVQNLGRVLYRLHREKSICHGDFYAHNILVSFKEQSVKLSDFGAAFFYDANEEYGRLLQRIELRSYSVLVEELYALVVDKLSQDEKMTWKNLLDECSEANVTFQSLMKHFAQG